MNLRTQFSKLAAMAALSATLLTAPAAIVAQRSGAARASAPRPTMAPGPVDINTASTSQLMAVPGIGATYAKRIIASRPYSSKDQLVSKGVLPQGVYDKVKNQLVAHRPAKSRR